MFLWADAWNENVGRRKEDIVEFDFSMTYSKNLLLDGEGIEIMMINLYAVWVWFSTLLFWCLRVFG